MKQNRKQLKAAARATIKEAKPSFALVTFVFLLLVTILPLAISTLLNTDVSILDATLLANAGNSAYTSTYFNMGMLGLFLSLVITLFTTVIGFGQTLWSLRCWRKEECTLGALVEGFATAPHVIFVMLLTTLMQLVQIFLGIMLFGILMTLFIHGIWAALALSVIGTFAISMIVILRYSFVHHVMADNPTMGAMKTISTATALTRKRLGELFCLHLSFFWWNLLALVIQFAGIAIFFAVSGTMIDFSLVAYSQTELTAFQTFLYSPASTWVLTMISIPLSLWLVPYTYTTIAGFYDTLVSGNGEMLAEAKEEVE